MQVISATTPGRLESLVEEFAKRFPHLKKPDIAIGRCKFYSMELAMFLRARGIKAQLYHVQEIKNRKLWPRAHPEWLGTRSKEWTHYVVRVGGLVIDLTSKQLDSQHPYPHIYPYRELLDTWNVVERDAFINRVATELLEQR